jgi:serine/threonine protein phosphatase PrpC
VSSAGWRHAATIVMDVIVSTVVTAGCYSDKGSFRPRNEDCARCDAARGVFVVADGVGGVPGGDRASARAVETLWMALGCDLAAGLPEALLPEEITHRQAIETILTSHRGGLGREDRLRLAFLLAHCHVLEEGWRIGSASMASAVVVAWLTDDGHYIGHVGDCRAYSFKDGVVRPLTEDHNLAVEADQGLLRHRLSRVVGGELASAPTIRRWAPAAGESALLCTDGVWGSLDEVQMAAVLEAHVDPQAASRELVRRALEAGSKDNATALVVRLAAGHGP